MIVPSQLALKIHTNFGSAASFAMLHKLNSSKQIFTIASIATYVMRLAAHSTTLTAMGQSLFYSNPVELVMNILLF
jgi:hypothetical protein